MGNEKKNRKRPQSQSRKSSLRRPGSDYFAWPHPFWMFAVSFGLYLLVVSNVDSRARIL